LVACPTRWRSRNQKVGRTPSSAPDPPVRLLLRSSTPTRRSAAGQGACPTKSARKLVELARNFAHLPRRQTFQKLPSRYLVKQRVRRFDTQEKPIPRCIFKPRHIENRMIRHRQSIQPEHAQ